jgi:hypothetical protein
MIAQLEHYFDAIELEWSSYILVYDVESSLSYSEARRTVCRTFNPASETVQISGR